MEKDSRYQWLESRLIGALEPKRDAIVQLIQNDDNRFVFIFLHRKKKILRNKFCFDLV